MKHTENVNRKVTPHAFLLDPKFATVQDWCALSAMSRTATYYAMGRGDLKAIKLGSRTLVDVEAGLAWLRSQPPAQIRPPKAA